MNPTVSAVSEKLFPLSLRTRSWRRAYVVLAYALAGGTIALAAAGEPVPTVLLGLTSAVFFALYWMAIQGLTDRQDSDVDERERSVRDDAHRQAFQALVWIGIPVLLVAAFAFPDDVGIIELVWALTAVQVGVWGMPGAVVAWNQPDDTDAEG